MSAITNGILLVVQAHFDAGRSLNLVEKYDVTYISSLATMCLRMIDHEDFDPERVDTLRRGTVGFLSMGYEESAFERIEDSFGFPVVQPYGLSEGNSQLFVGDPDAPERKRKRIGGRSSTPMRKPGSSTRRPATHYQSAGRVRSASADSTW